MRFFCAVALSCLLTGCDIPTPGAFYQAGADKTAPPGTLIRSEMFYPQISGADAYRVLYDSTDIHGGIVAVSGVVYVPQGPAPAGGRNVVAWAHPTTGTAPGCAPSLDSDNSLGLSTARSIPGLRAFIAAGDIVAATDYAGMGVAAVHPYLIGQSAGASVIDSVRAAGHLPGAALSGNFAVWGHSQGGHAVLFAGQMAASYAPELHLVGVVAAAPPSDLLGEFAVPFSGDSDRLLGAYLYNSWSQIYDIPITGIVYPDAVAPMRNAASKCINSLGQGFVAIRAAGALDPVFLSHKPYETAPWHDDFIENSPGHAPPGAPLLIVQGNKDPTVKPHWNRSFAQRVCAKHEVLDYVELDGVGHVLVAYKATPMVVAWIAARFAGQTPPDNCP